jgi:DNA-binding NarL/FixJ family response regulator
VSVPPLPSHRCPHRRVLKGKDSLKIHVAIIDDQDIIRFGVQQLLSTVPTISLLGSFSSIEAFCDVGVSRKVSVVLLDDTLPEVTTRRTVHSIQLAAPGARLLVLGRHLTASTIHDLLDLGVLGFICKEEPLGETLVSGIRRVHLGKLHFSPEAAAISRDIEPHPSLSPRLEQVLVLTARGLHVQAIARTLDISTRAVYAARARLRAALDVNNDAQLGSEAFRRGLLDDIDDGDAGENEDEDEDEDQDGP